MEALRSVAGVCSLCPGAAADGQGWRKGSAAAPSAAASGGAATLSRGEVPRGQSAGALGPLCSSRIASSGVGLAVSLRSPVVTCAASQPSQDNAPSRTTARATSGRTLDPLRLSSGTVARVPLGALMAPTLLPPGHAEGEEEEEEEEEERDGEGAAKGRMPYGPGAGESRLKALSREQMEHIWRIQENSRKILDTSLCEAHPISGNGAIASTSVNGCSALALEEKAAPTPLSTRPAMASGADADFEDGCGVEWVEGGSADLLSTVLSILQNDRRARPGREQTQGAIWRALDCWAHGSATRSRMELSEYIKVLGQRGFPRGALDIFHWMQQHHPGKTCCQKHPNGLDEAARQSANATAEGSTQESARTLATAGSAHDASRHVDFGARATTVPASGNGATLVSAGQGAGNAAAGAENATCCWRKLQPNGHTYSLVLGILGRAGMLREAESIFGAYRVMEFREKVHGYNAMLAARIRQGGAHQAQAWALFREMLHAPVRTRHATGGREASGPGAEPNAAPFGPCEASVMRANADLGQPSAVPSREGGIEAGTEGLRRPLPGILAARAPGEAPAQRALDGQEQHLFLDATSDSTDSVKAQRSSSSALQRPSPRITRVPAPDAVSFNTMIGACLRVPAAAVGHLKSPRRGGVPVEVEGIGVLGEGSADTALWLYREMRRRALRPSMRTFNALLSVLGREEKWDDLEDILHGDMARDGLAPDIFTFNILITAYSRAHRLGDALRAYSSALAEGLQPTAVTMSALMSAYAAAGRTQEAVEVFAAMEDRLRQQGHAPDTAAFCGLMAVYKEAGMADEAERTLRRMIAQGVTPNTVAYSCLVHAFGREGRLEDAARVFEEMLNAGDSACPPDVQAFNILMTAYGQQGLSLQAARLFRSMQAHGLVPDAVTYNTLIQAYVRAGEPQSAEKAYAHMLGTGARPDRITISLMCRAYHDAGQHHRAEELKRRRGGATRYVRTKTASVGI